MATANQVIQNASTRVLFLAVEDRDTQPPENTLLELTGANTASDSSGIQTVDISSFGDGFSVPKVKPAIDATYTVSGVVTDNAAHLAYRSLADGADKEKEAFVMIINGDGSTVSFYAMVSDYSTDRVLRDVLRFTSSLNAQSLPVLTADAIASPNTVTHNGETVTHNGEPVTHTP